MKNFGVFSLSLLLILGFVSCDYSPADALEYAYASASAYCDPDSIESWTCGAACQNLTGYQPFYSEVFTLLFNETLSFSMIYNPSTEKFVTVFRGTVTTIQLDLEFVESDALPFGLENIPNALVQDYFYTRYVNVIRPVIQPKIQEAYANYSTYDFIFTGHSLGAALSTFCAFDIAISGLVPVDQIQLYNFGSPRVGNQAFAEAVQNKLPEIYRVVHWQDYVPHVPICATDASGQCTPTSATNSTLPGKWPAWHVAQEIFYNEANTDYVICNGGEDPTCADQFPVANATWADHGYYVNVHMACDPAPSLLVETNA